MSHFDNVIDIRRPVDFSIDGRAYRTGLGFYTGMPFHVDSNGFRRWGADGRGATSPCGSARIA